MGVGIPLEGQLQGPTASYCIEDIAFDVDSSGMDKLFPTEVVCDVDPDIIADQLRHNEPVEQNDNEKAFAHFFAVEWQDPKYDHLRETWDKHINDEDPGGRLLGKTALWSVVQSQAMRAKAKQSITELETITGKKIPYYE